MTAEIAIMNKEAIALASDSAITLTSGQDKKVFQSANKLFSLSKYHPVGIMYFNNAVFMKVPFETIVKVYKTQLQKRKFDTLKEYALDFINFLEKSKTLFPDSEREEHIKNSIYGNFKIIKNGISEKAEYYISKKGKLPEKEVKNLISEVINKEFEKWRNAETTTPITKKMEKR